MLDHEYHSDPVPHLYFPQLLPPDLYKQVTFPDIPERAKGRSGRDLFPGEPGYDEAVQTVGFKELHALFTSPEMITWIMSLFGRDMARQYCRAKASEVSVVPYLETREELNNKPAAIDENADPSEVFNRFDFTIGAKDYTSYVHLDSPRRIIGGLLFFSNEEDAIEGGEFGLYRDLLFGNDRIAHWPRLAKQFPPRGNTGVLFLNSNKGFHGPLPIRSIKGSRKWIYYSVSSRNCVWQAHRQHKRLVPWAVSRSLRALGIETGRPGEPQSKLDANWRAEHRGAGRGAER